MPELEFTPSQGTCYDPVAYDQKRCNECAFRLKYIDTMRCPYVEEEANKKDKNKSKK